MKCDNCGSENPPEDSYCGACGSLLASPEVGERWSKTYGIPGFWEGSVSEGPSGAEVETRFSLFGFSEKSVYPRWMITSMVWAFVGLLFFLGLLMISAALKADRLDFVGWGLVVLGLALLTGYVLYGVYYRPPRH